MTHKTEIITSRKGGFGGSDAKMFLKVGKNGIESLSETDKMRIAVALGQIPYKETFTTKAMQAGNEFEEWIGKHVLTDYESNPRICAKEKYRNFSIFAHPDFVNDRPDHAVGFFGATGYKDRYSICEVKYTTADFEQTAKDYESQLQWYYMLRPSADVFLYKGTQGKPFEDYNFAHVEKSDNIVDAILQGINLIDDFCDTFVYEQKEEWSVEDLLPFEQTDAQVMFQCLSEIKVLEEKVKEYRERMLNVLLENNVKSLKHDKYTLSVVGESIRSTFDKKQLLADYPEINESDYLKKSIVKPFLKINLK